MVNFPEILFVPKEADPGCRVKQGKKRFRFIRNAGSFCRKGECTGSKD